MAREQVGLSRYPIPSSNGALTTPPRVSTPAFLFSPAVFSYNDIAAISDLGTFQYYYGGRAIYRVLSSVMIGAQEVAAWFTGTGGQSAKFTALQYWRQ